MKKLLLLGAIAAAMLTSSPAPAESICADAGTSNPLGVEVPVWLKDSSGISIPAVCVWVP